MFQDYLAVSVRSAAILTNAYVAGTVIENCHRLNQLVILAQFTIGSLTDVQIKVEVSNDGTNYYQQTGSSISGGVETDTLLVHKFTASGNYRVPIQTKDRFIRISAIGTGTVTSSSLTIDAVVGVA